MPRQACTMLQWWHCSSQGGSKESALIIRQWTTRGHCKAKERRECLSVAKMFECCQGGDGEARMGDAMLNGGQTRQAEGATL